MCKERISLMHKLIYVYNTESKQPVFKNHLVVERTTAKKEYWFYFVRKGEKGMGCFCSSILLFDLCTWWYSFSLKVNWWRDIACACTLLCMCVSGFGSCLYLCLPLSQVQGSAPELLSQADPWECREFLPDAPGHSALAAPTLTHTHTPHPLHPATPTHPTPTPLTDTAQRADTWLCTHTHTHTPWGTLGKVRDQQKHSRETGEDRRDQMQDSTQQRQRWRVGEKKVRLQQRHGATIERSTCQTVKLTHKTHTHKRKKET